MKIYSGITLIFLASVLLFSSCKKEKVDPDLQLIFKVQMDPDQERYNSLGQLASVPIGNAAQNPRFNGFSAHVIELSPNAITLPGEGAVVYQGDETNLGASEAVDFDKASVVAPGEVFFTIPLADVPKGTYPYIRVSVTYQNYEIDFQANGQEYSGTLASFVGFNTYLTDYTINTSLVNVNASKPQGYWGFEALNTITTGQAPAGATTVPNPIAATSPIPLGSCLVTGSFETPLEISHTETENIVVNLSFSTNQSFEWIDPDGNGTFDPLGGDVVIDMGLRGLKASVE